ADVDALIELDSDPEVMRFLSGGAPTPPEVIVHEILPRFLARDPRFPDLGFWAAEEKASGAFIGWVSLRSTCERTPRQVELGFRLRRAVWCRGYATEAV